MQAFLAIARLTFKAAFRFRLVPLLAVMLIGSVFLLPAVIKDDGTARGLTQIVLTYTLGLITAVLGLTTLWLACGTLARDIDDCTIQTVAVKPVARWRIWLGKWAGIMLVNLLLLGVSAGVVFAQMLWRAQRLPPEQQQVLRNEIFVARGSVREPLPDLEPEVQRRVQERLQQEQLAAMDRNELARIIREQLKAELQVVPPGFVRAWAMDLSAVADSLRDQPLFIRVKFFVNEKSESGTYTAIWDVGPPDSPYRQRTVRSQAAETFYEIELPPNLLDDQGVLHVHFINTNDTAVLFPLEDGFEVLYREGGFTLNYFRGVTILLCWLALLAAIGLAAASLLSFPVAAFVSLALLVVAFSTGTMSTIVEQGGVRPVNPNTGLIDTPNLFDRATVLLFQGLLGFVNLARDFAPVDALSTGRSVSWGTLARAVAQIVALMGGLFAVVGITIFNRRELATAGAKG
jgi:ABC-type transport system involved in multi-copper enzyme maturation permease subunit